MGKRYYVFLWIVVCILFILSCSEEEDDDKKTSSTPPPEETTTRTVIVSGRVTDSHGGPISGATIEAFIDGETKSTTSANDGFFELKEIPYEPIEGDFFYEIYLTLYFSAPNYVDRNFDVDLGSNNGFQVDSGPIVLQTVPPKFSVLGVTASVIRPSTAVKNTLDNDNGQLSYPYLESNQTIDDLSGAYLLTPSADITLTFNMPVDTTYTGTQFLEFFAPNGDAVPFSGAWDSTKTVFTINPNNDLIADNSHATRYKLKIARNVRAFNHESVLTLLNNVTIYINVVKSSQDVLLLSQAPFLSPSNDGKVGYLIDSALVHTTQLADNGFVEIDNATTASIYLRWNSFENAITNNIYVRNKKLATNSENNNSNLGASTSGWGDPIASISTTDTQYLQPDATFIYPFDLYNGGALEDRKFNNGETVEVVVTAVDADLNESSITTFISGNNPLELKDTQAPTVSASSYSAIEQLPSQNQIQGDITITFSEDMCTTQAQYTACLAAAPIIERLSGMANIDLSNASGDWPNSNSWKISNVQTSISIPNTTLTAMALAGDVELSVIEADKFIVGDSIYLINSSGNQESATISGVDTVNDLIQITGNGLTNAYQAGTAVRLLSSFIYSGMTDFRSELAAQVSPDMDMLSLPSGEGRKFAKDMNLRIWRLEEGQISLDSAESVTVQSIDGDTLTLTESTNFSANIGSLVTHASLVPQTPELRSFRTETTLAQEIIFDSASTSTTIAAASQSGNDAFPSKITVADASGFNPGDIVSISASAAETTLTQDSTGNTITVESSTNFQVNDRVRFVGETLTYQLSEDMRLNATTAVVSVETHLIDGEIISFNDPQVETRLAISMRANDTSITLLSTAGLAIGQLITFDDNPVAVAMIDAIAGNAVSITALGTLSDYPADTLVKRPLVVAEGTVNGTVTSTTIPLIAAHGVNLSELTTLTIVRSYEEKTITSLPSDTTITFENATSAHDTGTVIRLLSYPEVHTVTDVSFGQITLSDNLRYSHHVGATVVRDVQKVLAFNSLPTTIVVGDTVMIDKDSDSTTVKDRFEATITAVNTAKKTITIETIETGVIPGSVQVVFMGDAFKVSNVQDSNGNPLEATHSMRFNTAGVVR